MLGLLIAAIVFGQTPAPPAARHVGAVLKVDTSARTLLIRLDNGGEKWISAPPDVEMLEVAPGDKDLSGAAAVTLEAVRVGDRLLVRRAEYNAEIVVATQIVLIRQKDLTEREKAEQADWKSRGISGRVLAVEAGTGHVTISTISRQASGRVTIGINGSTIQRRYRPGSARFTDARPSSMSDIRVGDQLLALGDRTPDGLVLTAEKIISGSFGYFPATVVSSDPQRQQFTARLADGNRLVEVAMAPGSVVRRFPPGVVANSTAIAGTSLPVSFSGLKPGDAVVIATVENGAEQASSRLVAIAVISGVEALLKRSTQEQREALGSWDLKVDVESGDTGGGRQ